MKKNARSAVVFGKTLKEVRLRKGWTQEQLGLESGLDRSFLTRLENGKTSPSLDTVMAIAAALGLKLSDLSLKFEKNLGKDGHEEDPVGQSN